MKKELQDKLYEKHPDIFKQKDLPMTETAMCWGIQCSDGWFDLIDNLCTDIQEHIKKNKLAQVEATTVKEKFGTLRFYIDTGFNDEIYEMIQKAEEMSCFICEHCGAAEDVTQTTGWIVTLCPACMKEYKKRKL